MADVYAPLPQKRRYAPLVADLVAPPGDLFGDSTSGFSAANQMRACRVVVPKSGTLRDLYVFVGTASGNAKGSVYDVGKAASAVRTLLWEGASVAVAANWLALGDPQIPVAAGQHLDLALQVDNTTAAFSRKTISAINSAALPAGLGMVGGCLLKLAWAHTPAGFAAPATLTEGNVAAGSILPVIVGRVA